MASYSSTSGSDRRSALLFGVAVALAALTIFALGSSEADPDLFWHLQVARLIESGGVQPLVDTFSYNSLQEPWLPYSWLAELAMLGVVEGMGAWSLIWIPLLCYSVMLTFLTLTVVGECGTSFKSVVIVVSSALLTLPFLGLRPATFAFPLCALGVWLIAGTAGSRLRSLALSAIVPLTIVLANIHLFFVFPPLVLLVRGGSLLLQRAERRRREGLACLGLAGLALGLALLINPFGLQLSSVIVHYLSSDAMVGTGIIEEMRPFYRMGFMVVLVASLLVVWPLVGIVKGWASASLQDVGSVGLALALLSTHGRYAPLAVLLLAPLAARYGAWPRGAPARRLEAVISGAMIAVGLYAAQESIRDRPPARLDAYLESRTDYPVAAARFVRDSLPRTNGRLINELGWGGYLIYALWPDYQVLVDGRTQVYPERLWRALYVDASGASQLAVFQRADADVAILHRDSHWAEPLQDSLDWTLVYEDRASEVWVGPRIRQREISGVRSHDATTSGAPMPRLARARNLKTDHR